MLVTSIAKIDFVPNQKIDFMLMGLMLALASVGLVIVASASIDYASERYNDAWYIVRKQTIFLMMGFSLSIIAVFIPMSLWQKYATPLLIIGMALLVAVLFVGREVNGSKRWLSVGPIAMQASEMAKLCLLVFFSGYLARRNEFVRTRWSAFFIMTGLIGLVVGLLLLEPDFGSAVVICVALGAMMFVAGVPFIRFALLALAGMGGMAMMAVISPYRWERLITFMDPWSRKFDSGYQLVQSLIAFGRGEFFGVGLGNSAQKALFLPESHTDFIFAVFFEEFGLLGSIALIVLVAVLIGKIIHVGFRALSQQKLFGAYLCIGIAVMFAVQAFINMGVASGLLPTKGLTFPFVSYGGSSLLISCLLFAFVFRVAWENKHEE